MVGDEDNLVLRSAKGEPEAFAALYDRYHEPIYRFIYLRTGSREEAEDLTHQVFLAAWEHLGSYESKGHPFSSWLYRIARNRVIDHYRVRRDTVELESPEAINISDGLDIEFAVDATLALDKVKDAIRKLSHDYQEVVILRFVEELSLKETAAAMERSEGAVKLLQHRALKELRAHLTSNYGTA
jgi:RNA polymerase sigma-70 factor (ECF subfamily)